MVTQALKVKSNPQASRLRSPATVNLPNLLTASRILLVPVFIVLLSDPTPTRSLMAAGVFALAALTDLLDGYLARRRAQVTALGRLLDPLADKFLVISGLILLVDMDRVAAWLAVLLTLREIGVTGLRAVAASSGLIIEAGLLGKYKVALQVFAILFLLLSDGPLEPSFLDLELIGTLILYLALLCSLTSGVHYLLETQRQLFRT
ncbi:MAG: CDP-diacylglycerol--glycerol-3-phosphate 3-phosphatidyltransferase [Nitrospirae bacterium]|nr:MAG: CDP-diacylglycerol--glycerol-3-phosphate 3-phosphatidyltransferase [Nitrospirota bacterium]